MVDVLRMEVLYPLQNKTVLRRLALDALEVFRVPPAVARSERNPRNDSFAS